MKKRSLLIAAMLSMVAVGGIATYEIIKNTTSEEVVCTATEKLDLEESDNADDSLFGGNSEKYKISLTSGTEEEEEFLEPIIGKQHFYDSTSHELSIRFFAVLSTKNVRAVWTRALYDSEGKVSSAFGKGTYTSTTAYTALEYYKNPGDVNPTTAYPSDFVEDNDLKAKYKYFVVYTIKGIPDTYSDCFFDARLEISNSTNTIASKTCSVETNETATKSAIEVSDVSTYRTTHTGNNYISHSAKTLYKSTDTQVETINFSALLSNGKKSTTATASGFDNTKSGKQTITLDFGRASTTFDIYVVDTPAYYDTAAEAYVVTVDGSYIGEIGASDDVKGNQFTTISQALEFLQDTDRVPYASKKILNIAAGYYNEKLEITTANLTIQGATINKDLGNIAKATYASDQNYSQTKFANSTIIEWNDLFGEVDYWGTDQVTDSTQTVAIRDTATNCKISDVVISNAWNCKEIFVAKGKDSEHRALALLCQADQFVMEYSALLGYQDTLELMTGRQYLNKCYISGTTDYIFGTNNITLFEDCTIHTIYNGSSSNGGYITAFKGKHSGNDSPEYGAVFYNCALEGDNANGKTATNVALGRPWADYAKVAFVDCTMTDCISTTAYDNTVPTVQGARYVAFSYNNGASFYRPTDSNVSFIEHGTLGDGAINQVQAGMSFMTDEVYESKFKTSSLVYATLFGKTNGDLTYTLAWNPKTGLEVDNNKYYVFHGTAPTTGTSYEFDSNDCNKTGNYELGDLELTNVQRRTSGNDDLYVGGSISFSVAAGTTVTITSYPGYHDYKIGDKYADADTVSYYFAIAQEVVIEKAGSAAFYLYSITINSTNQSDTATYTGIGLSSDSIEIYENTSLDLSNLKVYAEYSSGYIIYLDSNEYTRTGTVDTTTPGNYSYTYTYDGKSKNLNVTVLENVVESIAVTGYKTTYGVGSEFDDTMTVKATYSNESVVTLTSSDYEIDYSEVDFDTVGSYDVTVTYKANPSISTSFSVTVSAGEYTVTFMDGETVKSSCTGAAGNSITYPSDTTKAGYQFVRYYLDSDFTEVFDETVIPSRNVTVYMRYMQLSQSGVTYISSVSELESYLANPGNTAYLTCDLDMTGSTYAGKSSQYNKNFNGFGYKISNWSATYTSSGYSFFGEVYSGTIEDVIFENCTVSDGGSGLQGVGLLTSAIYTSETFKNIIITGCTMDTGSSSQVGIFGQVTKTHTDDTLLFNNISIINSAVAGTQYIGGIVGYMNGTAKLSFENCHIDVKCATSGVKILGGITGQTSDTSSINVKDTFINFTVTNGDTYIGGIVGYGKAGTMTVSNTNIELDIKAAYSIGGAIGEIVASTLTISNTHVEGSIIATNGSSNYENTFVGRGDNGTNFSTCTYSNFTLTGASATLQGTEV